MTYLSKRERTSLLMMWRWDHKKSYNEVRQIFSKTFSNENTIILRSTVDRTVRRFNETDSTEESPNFRTTNIGDEIPISARTKQINNMTLVAVQRILKKSSFIRIKIMWCKS